METRSENLPTAPPLWASALLAAGEGSTHRAVRHHIEWESGRACLRFTNGGSRPAAIPALGIQLAAGCVLDVRWPAGATAYEFRVRKGPSTATRARILAA
jgi:hypothetical protein